nr:hypothetical protein [Xanthomonas arboricola]
MPLDDTRHHQMFPELDAGQLAITRRFASGPAQRFDAGEIVFEVGDAHAPVWVVLELSLIHIYGGAHSVQRPVVSVCRTGCRPTS